MSLLLRRLMQMKARSKQRLLAVFVLWFCSALLIAQQRPELTMEWAIGKEGRSFARVPRVVWLQDGSAALYNVRLPEGERTFEHFDPASGERRPMLDAAKAIASLKALMPNNESKGIDWPDDFDKSASKAAYIIDKDVFV